MSEGCPDLEVAGGSFFAPLIPLILFERLRHYFKYENYATLPTPYFPPPPNLTIPPPSPKKQCKTPPHPSTPPTFHTPLPLTSLLQTTPTPTKNSQVPPPPSPILSLFCVRTLLPSLPCLTLAPSPLSLPILPPPPPPAPTHSLASMIPSPKTSLVALPPVMPPTTGPFLSIRTARVGFEIRMAARCSCEESTSAVLQSSLPVPTALPILCKTPSGTTAMCHL